MAVYKPKCEDPASKEAPTQNHRHQPADVGEHSTEQFEVNIVPTAVRDPEAEIALLSWLLDVRRGRAKAESSKKGIG